MNSSENSDVDATSFRSINSCKTFKQVEKTVKSQFQSKNFLRSNKDCEMTDSAKLNGARRSLASDQQSGNPKNQLDSDKNVKNPETMQNVKNEKMKTWLRFPKSKNSKDLLIKKVKFSPRHSFSFTQTNENNLKNNKNNDISIKDFAPTDTEDFLSNQKIESKKVEENLNLHDFTKVAFYHHEIPELIPQKRIQPVGATSSRSKSLIRRVSLHGDVKGKQTELISLILFESL